jgi:hypothetical protein
MKRSVFKKKRSPFNEALEAFALHPSFASLKEPPFRNLTPLYPSPSFKVIRYPLQEYYAK